MKQPHGILAAMLLLASTAFCPGDEMENQSGWPDTKELVAGRLAIKDHAVQQGAHVLSAIVELKNLSGHALDMDFDPHDLRVELFNSDGDRIDEDAAVHRSGPIPMSHRMTLSAGAYAGLPTHRGGIGLPVDRTMLAAVWQVWTLPPGKYTMKGTAKITAGFGSAALDPLLPNRGFKANENDFPPVGKTKSISVELQAVSFQVDAINAEDAATVAIPASESSDGPWSEAVNGLQARLLLMEKEPLHGHRWLVPYLELRNVRNLMNAMEVDCSGNRLQVELVDKDGKPLRSGHLGRSGPAPDLSTVILPFDSSMHISLECRNWGMGGAAMVATDSGAWHISEEENGKVFLRATLTGDQGKLNEWKTWHDKLRTPLIPVTWGGGNQTNDPAAVSNK